ncbi:hypothetical protein [Cognatishimia maritima]|uniref:Uncharacterized protein n=1 Tax=Cognatishimia maritima TaxID=870908 RepID=A0A1M5T315_9RHOB|nr:hypothetical protein [Cognatishimia maritima]SHH45000.1 hypothetical protein SAMN04488044_2565 [Cognatishimia maritima]
MRKHANISLSALCLSLLIGTATQVSAQECFADYKAKQNNPLRLHYGVAAVNGSCEKANAEKQLPPRLNADGWVLLNVLSVFDTSGLEGRKADAGEFYLRY